jgi:hypothetical protein
MAKNAKKKTPADPTTKTYTMTSNGLIHTPGIVGWLRAMYVHQPAKARQIVETGYPGLSAQAIDSLFLGAYTVEGENVVIVVRE